MGTVFVACETGFKREYTRSKARGYNRFIIDEDVDALSNVVIESDNRDLIMKKVSEGGEPDAYIILCKEFGLDDFKNNQIEISVIFLDEGYMLITLKKGALAIYLDNNGERNLVAPSIGLDKTPVFNNDSIYWCNADTLMSYSMYFKDFKDKFIFDFDFSIMLAGTAGNNNMSFKFKTDAENDVDISLGAYAKYLEGKKIYEEHKKADNFMQQFLGNNDNSVEFDEDDDDTSDEDDEYGDDYDDY